MRSHDVAQDLARERQTYSEWKMLRARKALERKFYDVAAREIREELARMARMREGS